jgi:heptosyltransferase-2/heptosyltransferase-3
LISRLLQEDHADAVILHGSPRESRVVRRLVDGLPTHIVDRCHDFSEDLSLELLPAVLAEQSALISVDTGTAHLAAAVGCPLLVFFGPTDPARFAPRGNAPIEVLVGEASCQFCHGTPLYKACDDNRCLNRLEDERLWGAWVRLHDRLGNSS